MRRCRTRGFLYTVAVLTITVSCSSASSQPGPTGDDATTDATFDTSAADTMTGDTPTCPSSLPLACAGACVDPKTDAKNCGGCGIACGAGQECTGGACRTPGCTSPADCDDGFSCTIDSCSMGACSHTIGPNAGATACPAGQFCVLGKGCVKGKACATSADCADTDPCTTYETCDPATSVCVYQVLDKDRDGHPPQVCGGDDCNDNDATVYPGAKEICDGRDNGCTGSVDVGAACSNPLTSCQFGMCTCKPENLCGSKCVDKSTNVDNCGSCGNACPSEIPSRKCVAGSCTCNPADQCGGKCVSLKWDHDNCSTCGNKCAANLYCENGTCDCTGVLAGSCSSGSVSTCSDPSNCGTCCTSCGAGTCVKGLCTCGTGLTTCAGSCVSTKTDRNNCGACGSVCGVGTDCICGTCLAAWKQNLATCSAGPTDLSCDAMNCGKCGVACGAGLTCLYGACR